MDRFYEAVTGRAGEMCMVLPSVIEKVVNDENIITAMYYYMQCERWISASIIDALNFCAIISISHIQRGRKTHAINHKPSQYRF